MNTLFSIAALLIMVMTSSLTLDAQHKSFSTALTVGTSTDILDGGVGIHFGINPAYDLNSYVAIESQVSYIKNWVSAGFINGESDKISAINAMIGGRIYICPKKMKARVYFNFLYGSAQVTDFELDDTKNKFRDIAASMGLFFSVKHFLIGLSAESPSHYILKVGYVF